MNSLPIGANPVPVPEGRSLSDALRLMFYIFLLFLPLLCYVTLSVHRVSEEYRISEMVKERLALMQEHTRLQVRRDALLSPAAVDAASRRLSMVLEEACEPSVGKEERP